MLGEALVWHVAITDLCMIILHRWISQCSAMWTGKFSTGECQCGCSTMHIYRYTVCSLCWYGSVFSHFKLFGSFSVHFQPHALLNITNWQLEHRTLTHCEGDVFAYFISCKYLICLSWVGWLNYLYPLQSNCRFLYFVHGLSYSFKWRAVNVF